MNSAKRGHEATKDTPCPICQKTDWCFLLNDGAVVCGRSDIAPPGWDIVRKPAKDGRRIFRPSRHHLEPRSRKTIATWKRTDIHDPKTSAIEHKILFEYSSTQRLIRRQWSDRRATYRDKSGQLKTKLVRPEYLDGDIWKRGRGPNPWPLYREDDIQSGDVLFFVGGETCVETLRSFGFSATAK